MFKTILVPIDGSALSYKPMATAVELAKLGHGRLIMLSVAEPRMFNSTESDALRDSKSAEAMNVESAKDNIRKALDSVRETSVPWEGVIALSRMPSEAILETARNFQCDVILMATRGKLGALDTLLSESTTQEVLGKTSVPVLVFPNA